MQNILISLFVVSAFLIGYTYGGYSVFLVLLSVFSKTKDLKKSEECDENNDNDSGPPVTFLIAAYNEEKIIRKKIDNILSQSYPLDKITIIIASDASTDKTHEIVNSYHADNVRLIISPERRGKTHCENIALEHVQDEIIVFTDASTMLEKDCLRKLVRHFRFEPIGCVSTRDRSVSSETNKGENLYVRYEMYVRSLEHKIDSLVGLSGSCYAARKSLCTQLPDHLTRDFALPLQARKEGYISVDEPEALCFIVPTEDLRLEFRRKVRTFTNGISTLIYMREMLNILKYGKFSFLLWSHKVFRWLLPVFFIVLLLVNVLLFTRSIFFKSLFILQAGGYAFSCLGLYLKSDSVIAKFSRVLLYFCITNLASLLAGYSFLKGEKFAHWNPTRRQ